MGGRRKRMKSGAGDFAESSCPIQVASGGEKARPLLLESGDIGPVSQGDNPLFENCSFASRCSIRIVNEVVSKFDRKKREMVKSIGFEGILYFPSIKQSNRPFAMWLMSSVDAEECLLRIGEHISIRFNKFDVGYVLGVPSSGRRIAGCGVNNRSAKENVMNRFLSVKTWEQRSIKAFQEIIEAEYELPMSKNEEDNFKIAFVVFIVSNLLSPSSKHDYASIDYWGAIEDPDDVVLYDWSDFVLDRLIEGVRKLKQDAAKNIKFPNMTGCAIFLQVLYLDSLALNGFVMVHNCLPRVRQFNHDKLRAMIAADSNYNRFVCGNDKAGLVTLRDAGGCIYSWAWDFDGLCHESRSGHMLAVWESAVAMVQLLNIPLEAAGPVFVAAADFQQQVNFGLEVNGTQAVKFMSVLVSIMIPYVRGFRHRSSNAYDMGDPAAVALEHTISNGIKFLSQPIRRKDQKYCNTVLACCSRSCETAGSMGGKSIGGNRIMRADMGQTSLNRDIIGDHVQESVRRAIAGLDGMAHYLDVDLRVATAMSQFFVLVRRLKPVAGFDLNSHAPTDQSECSSSLRMSEATISELPSPWELGYNWAGSHDGVLGVTEQLGCFGCGESMAIIHRSPKYIQLGASDLRAQMSGSCEFDADLFDLLIRSVRQEDDDLYSRFGNMRWRFFFEADFMDAILSGSFDCLDSSLGEHLSLMSSSYDTVKCKLIFFPALIQSSWVCFAWSLERNVIYVFEPSFTSCVPERRLVVIERACYRLKLAMQTFAGPVLQG